MKGYLESPQRENSSATCVWQHTYIHNSEAETKVHCARMFAGSKMHVKSLGELSRPTLSLGIFSTLPSFQYSAQCALGWRKVKKFEELESASNDSSLDWQNVMRVHW